MAREAQQGRDGVRQPPPLPPWQRPPQLVGNRVGWYANDFPKVGWGVGGGADKNKCKGKEAVEDVGGAKPKERTEVERILDELRRLNEFEEAERPPWWADAKEDADQRLAAARAARDRAKPLAAQLRDANAELEKDGRERAAAAEAERAAVEALEKARERHTAARAKEVASRARAMEVQALWAAAPQDAEQGGKRTTANDVDVLRVQMQQCCAQLGGDFDASGLPAIFELLAEKQRAAAQAQEEAEAAAAQSAADAAAAAGAARADAAAAGGGAAPPQPANGSGGGGADMDEDGLPELTEEEEQAWLRGSPPDQVREPEQHKRFAEIREALFANALKRQRRG